MRADLARHPHMDTLPPSTHWSTRIVDSTSHRRLAALDHEGFVSLCPADDARAAGEVDALEFVPWQSGGDTLFAPLTSATGALDCGPFWEHGRPDVGGRWTANAERAPALCSLVEELCALSGRVGRARVIRLQPQDRATAIANLHRDENNRLNPESEGWIVRFWQELSHNPGSHLLLMDRDDDGRPRPETERLLPLPIGARTVVDSQRLWHAVIHPGDEPRHALIVSVRSSAALDAWIDCRRPEPVAP